MIPDRDVWQTAVLVKRYGDDAMLEGLMRSNALQPKPADGEVVH